MHIDGENMQCPKCKAVSPRRERNRLCEMDRAHGMPCRSPARRSRMGLRGEVGRVQGCRFARMAVVTSRQTAVQETTEIEVVAEHENHKDEIAAQGGERDANCGGMRILPRPAVEHFCSAASSSGWMTRKPSTLGWICMVAVTHLFTEKVWGRMTWVASSDRAKRARAGIQRHNRARRPF